MHRRIEWWGTAEPPAPQVPSAGGTSSGWSSAAWGTGDLCDITEGALNAGRLLVASLPWGPGRSGVTPVQSSFRLSPLRAPSVNQQPPEDAGSGQDDYRHLEAKCSPQVRPDGPRAASCLGALRGPLPPGRAQGCRCHSDSGVGVHAGHQIITQAGRSSRRRPGTGPGWSYRGIVPIKEKVDRAGCRPWSSRLELGLTVNPGTNLIQYWAEPSKLLLRLRTPASEGRGSQGNVEGPGGHRLWAAPEGASHGGLA